MFGWAGLEWTGVLFVWAGSMYGIRVARKQDPVCFARMQLVDGWEHSLVLRIYLVWYGMV